MQSTTLAPLFLLTLVSAPVSAQGCDFEVLPLDGDFNDEFGREVAVSGDWMAVGVPQWDGVEEDSGAVYLYERQGGSWIERQVLTPQVPFDRGYFGSAIDMEGDTLVVGAPGDSPFIARTAYVFERQGATWVERTRLDPPNGVQPSSQYASSVALEGSTLVVADPVGGAVGGSVLVFVKEQGAWEYATTVSSGDTSPSDRFGSSVDLSGNRLAIGCQAFDWGGPGIWEGAVFVFEGAESNWQEVARLRGDASFFGPSEQSYRFLGRQVSLDGDTLFVGTWVSLINSTSSTQALVFEHDGNDWVQVDYFGGSASEWVHVVGNRVALGAAGSSSGVPQSGAVLLKERGPQGWLNVAVVHPATPQTASQFGTAVAFDGETVVVGAFQQRIDGVRIGGALAFDFECAADDFATVTCLCRVSAPCGNEDEHAGCRNSTQLGGLLRHSGSPSLAMDDLSFDVSGLPSQQFGLVFAGTAGGGVPFGDGLRCVSGTLCRLSIQSTGQAGSFGTGQSLLNTLQTLGCPVAPGMSLHFQGWYRDPVGPCGTGFNLTNAIRVDLAP